MSLTLLGALLLASSVADGAENPRFVSPNGEMVLVIRRYPGVDDFERVEWEEYSRRREAAEQVALRETDPPPLPEPTRAALYHFWPGGYRELRADFAFRSGEQFEHVLVSDDGHVVTFAPMGCGAPADLLTIRSDDGSVVRRLRVRDVVTPNDQQWLCRGEESDVLFSVGETLQMTMLVTDGQWDDPQSRHHTIVIDLATGKVAAPDRNHCPAALIIIPEADDGLPRMATGNDVVPLASQELLDRAVVREPPEYPEVAAKARISGRVGVQVIVARDGRVETAAIVKPLPFGLDQAVVNAILKWHFRSDAARFSGVISFRFEIARDLRIVTHAVP